MVEINTDNSNDRRLMVVCGLPGSGKTTLAVQLEERFDAARFSADDWMAALGINLWDSESRATIEVLQCDLAKQFLVVGKSVVVEWGSWSKDERDELRRMAREIGVKVDLYFLDEPLDVLFERITNRGLEDPPISRQNLEEWSEMIERPTIEEGESFDYASVA